MAAAVEQIWPTPGVTGASFRRGLLDSTQIDAVAVGVLSPEPVECHKDEAPPISACPGPPGGGGAGSALARLLAEQQQDLACQGLTRFPNGGKSNVPPPPPRVVHSARVTGGWAMGGGGLLPKHHLKLNAITPGRGIKSPPRYRAAPSPPRHRAASPPRYRAASPPRHRAAPSPREQRQQRQAPLLSARSGSRQNTPRMDGVGLSDPVLDGLGLESPRYTQGGVSWAQLELHKATTEAQWVEPPAERKCVDWAAALERQENDIDAAAQQRSEAAYENARKRKTLPRCEVEEAFTAGKRLAGGEGGFGEVRQCTIDGGQVAIKRCRAPHVVQRREVALLHTCRHPNVLSLSGVCTAADGGLLIVTDLVKGGCLERVLLRPLHRSSHLRTLQLGRRLCAIVDAATGLAHVHRQNVVHGDVKPANILVGDPTVIADFGLSAFSGAQKDAPQMGFSEGYIAPEVEATARMTPASDVYALGMSLLQALVGGSVTDVPIPARKRRAETLVQALDEELHNCALQQGWTSGESAGILLWSRLCTQRNPRGRPGMAEVAAGIRSLRSAPSS
eukprot:Hpha_TRINITY_DN13813_c0_g1::TRINITY_DN13813_c0_g1_i1::g.69584::m.69584